MANSIYLLYNDEKVEETISNDIYVNKSFYSENLRLNESLIESIAKKSLTEFFIVIRASTSIDINRNILDFSPASWDRDYVHVWNNDTSIMLFNKENVIKSPSSYTSEALDNGQIKLKLLDYCAFSYPPFDIVFLSHGEPSADINYTLLKKKYPRAKRVSNIDGFLEAHQAAARLASTSMFYVVDADAYILPTFKFDYRPANENLHSVHVWYSRNPINDLEYGYGGIKLFPAKELLEYTGSPIDFTTSVGNLIVMDEVSNITRFNTNPFSTWRSAFRECAKLASKMIHNQIDKETEHRLNIWCSVGLDREFGEFAIHGADVGRLFGEANSNNPEKLKLINNYEWLKDEFNNAFPGFLLPED